VYETAYHNMKLGKAYERRSWLQNRSFFRFKCVIRYFMHRFRFHSERLMIIINPKSCDCSVIGIPRLLSLSYIENGGAHLELTLKISFLYILKLFVF
jgi:hypothetical protein